ncbi:MAG: AAA family ATPase [Proteobacteria bacterium]|nr:AAA family ATPase [Pseudomonadota bacterium]
MRLDAVTIGAWKNLKDFSVDFDEGSPYTVLVGENGAGKSNLIEALTLIFRNLDLDLPAPFAYELKYTCRGHGIRVVAEADRVPTFAILDAAAKVYRDIAKRRFMEADNAGKPLFRPAFVFGYYSGPSDRLASLYEEHRRRYYRQIIKPQASRGATPLDSNALRRLFYAQTLHGQFALLAFFMNSENGAGEDDRQFLRDHLQIDGLDSVLFALKKPPWSTTGKKGGDPRFWKADGEVRDFLDRLYAASLLPMRMDRRIPIDLTKDPLVESLYLFLPGSDALAKVYHSYGTQYAFFTALESTYISKVLAEVRTRVRMTDEVGGGAVTYRDLSEGEQQLLLVLGLLKFTAEDEALFLLDEPDTHLNPAWSTQYLEFLDRFIQLKQRGDTCHIIMTSHDPLVFSRLRRNEVQIFLRDKAGRVSAKPPAQDPRGMGIEAILSSDLFRLRSGGLDLPTQRDLDTQRSLSMKEGPLTENEREELREVTERLDSLGFWRSSQNKLFELFLQKWTEHERPEWRGAVELTPEQLKDREKLAADIVAELATKAVDSN